MFIELQHPVTGPTFINVGTIHEFYPEYAPTPLPEGTTSRTDQVPTTLSLVVDRGAGSPMTFVYGNYPTERQAEDAYAAVASVMGGISRNELRRRSPGQS